MGPISSGSPAPEGVSNCVFSYVNPAQLQPYFQMAETYTFADRMFQTNQGPLSGASVHYFGDVGSCSSGLPCPGAGSDLFAAENSSSSGPPNAGCVTRPRLLRFFSSIRTEMKVLTPRSIHVLIMQRSPTCWRRMATPGGITLPRATRSDPRRSGSGRRRSSTSADQTRRPPMAPPAWDRIGLIM